MILQSHLRAADEKTTIPTIKVETAHIKGPGKIYIYNDRLAFKNPDGPQCIFDPTKLRRIYAYGHVQFTTYALLKLKELGAEYCLHSATGHKFHARLSWNNNANIRLRIKQHAVSNSYDFRLCVSKEIVTQKISSQLDDWRHYQRQGKARSCMLRDHLKKSLTNITNAEELEELRGLEGSAGALWFLFLREQLIHDWRFERRSRRPARDPVNALLSLGYTLLINQMTAAIESRGLEPYLGIYHSFRSGRMSLACDLVEPLRSPAVERWVIASCNEGIISDDDFIYDNAKCQLSGGAFTNVISSWQSHVEGMGLRERTETLISDFVEKMLKWRC